ncbi:hypothetical protein V7128_02110 [Neobacillus vireti]|uniref:hypothetical protein n=1 Tax=Neobacillus vireti TaxID=220686 RepID=UPI002FFE34F3
MSKLEKGMIIKMSGLSVKKENGVFEVNSTWEKDCSVYKLKKDGSRIKSKYSLDIFSYKKIEQYGQIITLEEIPAAITEINKQLKARKENEIVISFESTDKKEYTNNTYIRVIKPIQTTKSIYAISTKSIFQLEVNEKWNSVTWYLVGKKGETLSNYNGLNMMNWSNKSMVKLFEEGYIEIVERVETVRKDIEQNEVSEEVETTPAIETIEEVQTEETIVNESIEEVIKETPQQIENNQTEETNNNEITYQTGTGLKGNGIEITFTSKPSEDTRNLMKANGYRWGGKNRSNIWWAILNDDTLSIAEQLASKQETTIPEPVSYPEIEIDDCTDEKYNISQQLQDREHDAYWVMRSSKRDHNKEIQELFTHYTDSVKNVLSKTDNQYYIYKLKSKLQQFKKNYHTAYIKYITHKANNPSWVTTGRGGMNVSRYNQKMSQQDKLMLEVANLPEEMKQEINKYKYKIKRDQETALKEQLQKELSQPLPELTFRTVTKEFDLYGNGSTVKTRFYECEGYSICKVWGAFRVFETSTGKEIYSTKSAGTLKDAKAYVSLMIKQQRKAS